MSQRSLAVLINGEWMGDLTDQNNLWGFQYAASWLSRRHPYPLSPSLPLGPEPLLDGATVRPVQWFFDNLLPEETLRTVIGREEGKTRRRERRNSPMRCCPRASVNCRWRP